MSINGSGKVIHNRVIYSYKAKENGTEYLYLQIILQGGGRRGRTIDLKKKWLYSLLYGNWRGRTECDLKEYLQTRQMNKIIEKLENARYIPSVERRVSLFEYFENDTIYFEKYKEYIKWGLEDEHPWVRRVAILCFKNYPEEITMAFEDSINTEIYTEVFAMIINAASLTLNDYSGYIKRYDWTECENNAILDAISKEKIYNDQMFLWNKKYRGYIVN